MVTTHRATTVTTLASETFLELPMCSVWIHYAFSATYVSSVDTLCISALYYTATHTALVIAAH